jgi:hypothetical protein
VDGRRPLRVRRPDGWFRSRGASSARPSRFVRAARCGSTPWSRPPGWETDAAPRGLSNSSTPGTTRSQLRPLVLDRSPTRWAWLSRRLVAKTKPRAPSPSAFPCPTKYRRPARLTCSHPYVPLWIAARRPVIGIRGACSGELRSSNRIPQRHVRVPRRGCWASPSLPAIQPASN